MLAWAQIFSFLSLHLWLFPSHTHVHSHTHTHTERDTLACWKLQRGRETGLPSTGRKRMEEVDKGGKEKEKTRGYTIEQKEKWRQKVFFWRCSLQLRGWVCAYSVWLCVCVCNRAPSQRWLLESCLSGGFRTWNENNQRLNVQRRLYLISPGIFIPCGEL